MKDNQATTRGRCSWLNHRPYNKSFQSQSDGPTFPPPGWCFMLSVEPILERTLRMSGPGAVLGLAVGLAVADVPEEVGLAVRGTEYFFSGPVPVVEDDAASLVVVVRVRKAAVVEVALRVVVLVFGLLGSAAEKTITTTKKEEFYIEIILLKIAGEV